MADQRPFGSGRPGGPPRRGGPPRGRPSRQPPGWDDTILPLPDASWRLVQDRRRPIADEPGAAGQDPCPCEGLGLWLDRLVRVQHPKAPNVPPGDQKNNAWSLKADLRAFVLGQYERRWVSRAGAQALARQQEMLASLPGVTAALPMALRTVGHLLLDKGRAASSESALSLHHLWGVPRIPASALKGAVRAWLEQERGEGDPLVRELLGGAADDDDEDHGATAGRAMFLDALPQGGVFRLALDVITPHQKPYYAGIEPPYEWHSPEPSTFLTVVDTTFVFQVAVTRRGAARGGARAEAACQERLHTLTRALREALADEGIGAKRSTGFGRFEETP